MKPSAVLFDCDGVLVDSEPATFALIQEDFATYGLKLSIAELEQMFIGGTIEGVARQGRALGAHLPTDWVESYYERLYARLRSGTELMPGIRDLLDTLDAKGIPYAVGSNGRMAKMEATLGQHPDIRARLEGRLFSGQDLGCPKPAPDLYLIAARSLGADPSRCVVIEDSPTGARAARAAGMRCLGFAPHGPNPRLAAEGAEIFTAMRKVPSLLGI
ncbi:HAD family hydrolase [Sedimentimonas flavescens]|uniref:HAD family hydrolase n=1 Tax=Sedimentimonas flavescens TaxID=2851012 RepID=UPI001C49ECFC|nr:HAD-IA family hydrolase [Sedimentimonas flavescens]MBW0158629.1 HAD-IA family hydrolase [Sedimentimonas flavescens]